MEAEKVLTDEISHRRKDVKGEEEWPQHGATDCGIEEEETPLKEQLERNQIRS